MNSFIRLGPICYMLTFFVGLNACQTEMSKPSRGGVLEVNTVGDPSLVSSDEDILELIRLGEQKKSKYSVEDFFRNPESSYYAISPNGEYFSYLAPYKSRMNIFVQKIGEKEQIRITSETERDISAYRWANNDRLLFIKDKGGNENYNLFGVDRDGQNQKDLTPFDSVRVEFIDDLDHKENEVIIGINKENRMLFEPYNLNIVSGVLSKLAENSNVNEPVSEWITDHNGVIRLAIQTVDGVNTRLLYRDDADSKFEEVITTNFKESFYPLFFDFDNEPVAYGLSDINRDKMSVVKFDLKKKEEIAVLFSHDKVDVKHVKFSKKRKCLTLAYYVTDKKKSYFFDSKMEGIYQRIKSELGDYDIYITDYNKEEDKFLVRTYSDRTRGSYYFYDLNTDDLIKLVDISPWLIEEDMAEMKAVEYQSRDGLTIHGYLTLPKSANQSLLPTVILPHGGPWTRNIWGFNPEVQMLADKGYAVFQMNFRGSSGYGRAFKEASFKEWGKKMQDDITDGVTWLKEQGIADPERIAIYGGSYGGYATLSGITTTPDLYQCAIDYVGVSNLHSFMRTIPPYWAPYLEMMYEMIGDPKKDSLAMAEASPINHVDKITCPLFVAQGANDPRVNIDESDQMVRALRERNIDVPYMVKYDEGHGFRNEENKFEFYKAMLGFLEQNMKQDMVAKNK